MVIASYNILNYDEISKDVTTRTKLMNDYKSIIQRRIRIEHDYLCRMKQLAGCPQMRKINNPVKVSQLLYNSLVNAINGQIQNITNHVSRMDTQILKHLGATCLQLENQSKRQLINASIIIKDYQKRYQEIQKLRVKVMKKSSQLRKLKEQYIVGTLIDMPFDKKNKLFIKTKQIQEVFRPLKHQFQQSSKNFNEKALHIAQKLRQILKRIQNSECQKVQLMKKNFMVLQISNSQFGANLIQDKASLLSRINNLQNICPELNKCQTQIFERQKKQMQCPVHDPCSYISSLFTNIVDTKNMQGLVIYGHEIKHRESISQCMSDYGTTQLQSQHSDSQFALVKEIAMCFKNIFNEELQFEEKKFKRLEQLMTHSPEGRKNFILCLQKFRTLSKFDISQKRLKPIIDILNIFLDQCLYELDTYNSKLLLVLSFTYYVLVENEKKDLHIYIKQHKIWKDKQWWESALLESSYQQLKIKPKKSQDVPITIWHIKGSGVKHLQNEHQLTAQNILFNQLTFYIHNMRLFDLKQETITRFANKYVKSFQLSSKIAADIEPFLKTQEASYEENQSQNGNSSNGSSSMASMRKKLTKKLF